VGVSKTPDISGGLKKPQTIAGVQKPQVSCTLPGVAKNLCNLLATLALLGELQTLGKSISGG